MLNTFPDIFSKKTIRSYILLLIVVSFAFYQYSMKFYFMVIGLTAVYCFFHFANILPQKWSYLPEKSFEKKLFRTAFLIRAAYVIFAYFFYQVVADSDFDFENGDVLFYHSMGLWGHDLIIKGKFLENIMGFYLTSYGDMGYPIYLSIVYTVVGCSLILTRICKALLSAYMCVLVYRLAKRNFDEPTARLAAILCMLMPNFIYYCGSHLKEAEMVFIVVLFAERADYTLRQNKLTVFKILKVIGIASLLFFVRIALAVVLLLSLLLAGVLSSKMVINTGKRSIVITALIIFAILMLGTGISNEVSQEWSRKDNQEKNMEWRSEREGGNAYAKYASKSIFAPLIFTIPFPTLVTIPDQNHLLMAHGGNYVKNIISFFTLFALLIIIKSGEWRKHVLILAIMLGYLLVIAVSEFAQSERFHLPALPFVIMFSAYGIAHLTKRPIRYFNLWVIFIFFAGIAWQIFKLKGRGMI